VVRPSSWQKNGTQLFLLKRHQFINGVGVENQSLRQQTDLERVYPKKLIQRAFIAQRLFESILFLRIGDAACRAIKDAISIDNNLQCITGWDFTFPKILSQRALESFCVCIKSHVCDLDWQFPFGKRSPFLIFHPVECVCKYFAKGVTVFAFSDATQTGFRLFIIIRSLSLSSALRRFQFQTRYFIIA
jgi:hypothetical protein